MVSFAFDYYLMVVISATGALQIAAAANNLPGLLLFRSHVTSMVFGAVLVVAGPVLFFATAERNINDYEGGLDGNLQLIFFFLGAVTAFALTAGCTSLLKPGSPVKANPDPPEGVEALRNTTFLPALRYNLSHWRPRWRK